MQPSKNTQTQLLQEDTAGRVFWRQAVVWCQHRYVSYTGKRQPFESRTWMLTLLGEWGFLYVQRISTVRIVLWVQLFARKGFRDLFVDVPCVAFDFLKFFFNFSCFASLLHWASRPMQENGMASDWQVNAARNCVLIQTHTQNHALTDIVYFTSGSKFCFKLYLGWWNDSMECSLILSWLDTSELQVLQPLACASH